MGENDSGIGSFLLGLAVVGGLGAGLYYLGKRKGIDPRLALEVQKEMWKERGEYRRGVTSKVQRRQLAQEIKRAEAHLATLRQQMAQAA